MRSTQILLAVIFLSNYRQKTRNKRTCNTVKTVGVAMVKGKINNRTCI